MKRASILSASILAASFAFANQAIAQSSQDQHHPGAAGAQSAQTNQMPGGGSMGQGGMGQGGMPQGGTGPGMMGQGGMGPGMMQGGMMQMMANNCPMMGNMRSDGEMPAFTDGRIAFLKAELGITDAQKVAWDAYAASLKKNMTGMQGIRQKMMTAVSATNPAQRLDAHLAAMESKVANLKEVQPALTKLYGALSAEQKKKADQILTGMGCMM